jgi:hypothetical protein
VTIALAVILAVVAVNGYGFLAAKLVMWRVRV